VESLPAIEHRRSPAGQWLRERRVRIALWIAVVEGLLVVFDVIAGWLALAVGGAIVAFWFFAGRSLRSETVRQASWTAALSQVFVALVPVLAFVVTALAVVALVVIALVALLALFADRR
jgi:hypothetical protein